MLILYKHINDSSFLYKQQPYLLVSESQEHEQFVGENWWLLYSLKLDLNE